MKKIITIIVFGIFLTSCGSKMKYTKLTEATEVKQPFKKENYEDTDSEFYSVNSSKGTNLNVIKAEALAAAQAAFSERIVVTLKSAADLKLANSNAISSSNFIVKLNTVGNSAVKKIKIVDSKLFTLGSNKKDLITYEYWAVYKVNLSDVIEIANNSNLGFDLNSNDF